MLADAFSVDRLGRVMGTVIISHTVGFLLGPVMGGFLYDYGGTLVPFYFCSVFGLLAFIGTICIAEPNNIHEQHVDIINEPVEIDESAPLLSSTSSSSSSATTIHNQKQQQKQEQQLLKLISNPRIMACLICCFVTSAALAGIEPALPIHLENKYHVSTSTIGGK